MTGTVVAWPQRAPQGGWTNGEFAELYRVEHSLGQAGLIVETECGVTDEGDPWFVFCHADGRVVVHAARLGSYYLLHCATLSKPLTGRSFSEIAKTFVAMIAKGENAGLTGRVVAHPSALLSLIVAAAMLSVDAVLHDTAHAGGLPDIAHTNGLLGDFSTNHVGWLPKDLFAPHQAPAAPGPSIAREFADISFSALWRRPDGSGQREPILQAVEDAAIGLSVLAAAFAFDSSLNELTGAVDPVAAPKETFQYYVDRGIPADSVNAASPFLDQADASADGRVESAVALPQVGLKLLPVNAVGFPALADVVLPAAETVSGIVYGTKFPSAPAGAVPQEETVSSAALSANSDGGTHLDVIASSVGNTIDLDNYALGSVTLTVSGDGALTVMDAAAIHSIEVASGTKVHLTLSFDNSPQTGTVEQTVTLNGGSDVSIEPKSTTSATPPLSLVVDSQGAQSNTLNLVDAANGSSSHLDVKVTGSQDLALNESASTAVSSTLDASALMGKLSVGIDFSDTGASAATLNLGNNNFVVTPEDTVAFVNLSGDPQFQLAVDLETVLFSYDTDAATGGPITLGIDLGSSGSTLSPVKIGTLAALAIDDLAITSSSGANSVGVIDDSNLSALTLTGNSSLKIASINGIMANDSQNVLIDAQNFHGDLILNATGILDTLAGGRQVEINTGSGQSSVTDTNVTEHLQFKIGSGAATVNIGTGGEQVTITGLGATDQIFVGSGKVADEFTNGLATLTPHQAAIDGSANLAAAAALAASLGEPSLPHEALLFSYRGSTYVFVDASGSHVFDPSADAIIKVVGATSSTDLTGVFHST
jgi:hypothetical protein